MYTEFEGLFYNRLVELRQNKKVSAREMSITLGQNENYINQIENRRAFPSMEGFFYICDYFGISPKEFFEDGKENKSLLNDLIKKLRLLEEYQLRNLLSIVNDMTQNF